MGNTEQSLGRILLSLTQSFSEVAGICEESSTERCLGVQIRLLQVGFVGHDGMIIIICRRSNRDSIIGV